MWKGLIKVRAWSVGLIGLLSPLLCAGLWSWGNYNLAERGYTGPFQRPLQRDHQAVLCTAWPKTTARQDKKNLSFLYPPFQRSYWYHLVRLSVCGQNRVRSVSSTILIGSISYLHILSSNFRRCVACNARCEIQKFDFVFFWLGIQYDSMVWVIMRRRGVSSERRRSSCSSLIWYTLS